MVNSTSNFVLPNVKCTDTWIRTAFFFIIIQISDEPKKLDLFSPDIFFLQIIKVTVVFVNIMTSFQFLKISVIENQSLKALFKNCS